MRWSPFGGPWLGVLDQSPGSQVRESFHRACAPCLVSALRRDDVGLQVAHARGPDCCGVQRHVLLFFSSNRRLNLRKSSKRGLPGRCSGHRRVLHASRCALRIPLNLTDPGGLASNISVSGPLSISPHKLPGGLRQRTCKVQLRQMLLAQGQA